MIAKRESASRYSGERETWDCLAIVPGSGKDLGSKDELEVASDLPESFDRMEVADSRRMRLAGVEVRKKERKAGRLGMAEGSRGMVRTNLWVRG